MKNKLLFIQWTKYCTTLYLIVLLGIFPLYYQNNYINILEAKTWIFKVLSVSYLLAGIISIWLVSVFRAELNKNQKKKTKSKTEIIRTRRDVQYVFLAVFVIVLVVSTLFSKDITNAWHGTEGKLYGTFVILLCCGTYLFISKNGFIMNRYVTFSLVIGTTCVNILAVLNRYGIDPLNMYSNLIPEQKDIYISTIGNVNILSGYLCIFFPLFMGLTLKENCSAWKCVYFVCTYLTMMSGICTNSDSFLMGLGSSLIFYLWIAMENKCLLTNYLRLVISCICAILTLRVFNYLSNIAPEWKNLQEQLIYKVPWGIIICIIIGFILIVRRINNEKILFSGRKIIFSALGIVIIISLIYIINVNRTGNGSKILLFNEKWGTNRGFAWIHTLELFKELPFHQKMIGVGPAGFKEFFSTYNLQRAAMGLPDFVDPHNECLYYLISVGIIGVISYYGFLFSCIYKALVKKTLTNKILVIVLLVWIIQSSVNNPIIFTVPYLFVIMGIGNIKGEDHYD